MTNEGGGVYSPDHWDPCPCQYCLERRYRQKEQKEQQEQQEQKQEETTNE